MPDIVLTTLNARYHHAAFGLRYLQANLDALESRSEIVEFGINESPTEMIAALLERDPKIIGIGVYIWNISPVTRLVLDLKRLRPDIVLVLGGPEVSYDTADLPAVSAADFVIQGEADHAFRELCQSILDGLPPAEKIIAAPTPALATVKLPYHLYSDLDIAQRVIYVEASRGCPFTCEFCLSALDVPVRQFDVENFLAAMQSLFDRGTRWFKFVDRTFNLNLRVSLRILEFFLARYVPGMYLHFEMIPDRLPNELRSVIEKFPAGALQFEVGIQTFNEEIADLISRKQDNAKAEANLRYLLDETGVHVHADLIFGLPGESLESFGAGFDRLVTIGPHEIQVGILKRLRGTPITRHDDEWQMCYSSESPYEILQTKLLSFETVQRVRRFSQLWDRVANRGHLAETYPLLWHTGSPFEAFLTFSDWLVARHGRSHAIAQNRLAEELFHFLTREKQLPPEQVAQSIWRDFQRNGRTDKPKFLAPFTLTLDPELAAPKGDSTIPARQARHLTMSE